MRGSNCIVEVDKFICHTCWVVLDLRDSLHCQTTEAASYSFFLCIYFFIEWCLEVVADFTQVQKPFVPFLSSFLLLLRSDALFLVNVGAHKKSENTDILKRNAKQNMWLYVFYRQTSHKVCISFHLDVIFLFSGPSGACGKGFKNHTQFIIHEA